jgi:uncharacterized protein
LKLSLTVLSGKLAICHLGKEVRIPSWATGNPFYSISKTADELSVVCPENSVPNGVRCEKNWKAFKVEGPLDFELTGILASLANPLAKANISIFALSTYQTDYLLVKEDKFEQAVEVLGSFCSIHR